MHKHPHEYRHKRNHSLLVSRRPSTVKSAKKFLKSPVATTEAPKFRVRGRILTCEGKTAHASRVTDNSKSEGGMSISIGGTQSIDSSAVHAACIWVPPETLGCNALYITLKVYLFYNFGGTWPSTDFQPLKVILCWTQETVRDSIRHRLHAVEGNMAWACLYLERDHTVNIGRSDIFLILTGESCRSSEAAPRWVPKTYGGPWTKHQACFFVAVGCELLLVSFILYMCIFVSSRLRLPESRTGNRPRAWKAEGCKIGVNIRIS